MMILSDLFCNFVLFSLFGTLFVKPIAKTNKVKHINKHYNYGTER